MSDPTRRLIAAFCCALLSGASSPAHGQSALPTSEPHLKAAFVFRFAQFAEWPSDALADRTTFQLCVSGPRRYHRALEEIVSGESLAGMPLEVRRLQSAHALEDCHVLFVLPSPDVDHDALLARAASLPILTVGDDPSFLDDGGIINLRIVDRNMRFEVNAAAAGRAGLRLSSQLLRLAVNIVAAPP